MSNNIKRILAAHDFSGFGHTSLMAAIAIFYRLGIRVAALPTALLSANTDHQGYQLYPFEKMPDYLRHWEELGLELHGVYTGFLGSPGQVQTLIQGISRLAGSGIPVLIDPVLGDHGELYDCYDHSMIQAMQELIKKASIITPNACEAAFLLGETPGEDPGRDWRNMAKRLSSQGPRQVLITSLPSFESGIRYCGVWDAVTSGWDLIPYSINGEAHPGSGDCFASFLFAGIINGYSLISSARAAVQILNTAIALDTPERPDWREGIQLERILSMDLPGFYINQ